MNGMEKSRTQTVNPIDRANKKERAIERLEDLWGKSSKTAENSKYLSKKLTVKLETNGPEKRKILLKMECGKSKINSNNYHLLSDLLKEFFNSDSQSE
ncbi:unnamed protein product [marine sediment metagenome]|uniref:Uncharacterized protein n=1 Tax=marine sediment metagenome TaxID=412755 RepID=X1CTV7_9ZZZZ